MKSIRSRRHGAGLIIALTTLLVVMLMTGTIVQSLVAEIRQTRRNAAELQVHWLADAALARAAAQLRASSAYSGETWQPAITADESDIGVTEIRVERTSDDPVRVKLFVEARYPDHPTRRITAHRSCLIPIPSPTTAADAARSNTNPGETAP
jgi:Tfp pilus assembly protein PilX